MRLFEFARKFYIGTDDVRKGIITVGKSHFPLGGTRESQLDTHRPEGLPSRQRSFYLSTTAGCEGEHVYEVEPVGAMHRFHTGWLKALIALAPGQPGSNAFYAAGYWSEKPFMEDRQAPWEYLAPRVRIIKRVGGTYPI